MPIYNKMTVDTIDLVVSVVGEDQYEALWSQLYAFQEIEKDGYWPKGWKNRPRQGEASLRLHISPQSKRKIAMLELGTTKQKHRWFKLRLYPNNFRGEEFAFLQEAMRIFLSDFEYL